MTMMVRIKPKPGRLASGAYKKISPIRGDCFPVSPVNDNAMPVEGGIRMLDDRTATVYRYPNSTARDTATQQKVAAMQMVAANSTILTPTVQGKDNSHNIPDIGPHERGKFFNDKVIPQTKTQFGASNDKASNTAFHPKKQPILPRPPLSSSARIARKDFLPSFESNNNLWSDQNNSFLSNRANVSGAGLGSGRWAITKRSVV
jgi:hypothetical protein